MRPIECHIQEESTEKGLSNSQEPLHFICALKGFEPVQLELEEGTE
jgi:hypothetical protein